MRHALVWGTVSILATALSGCGKSVEDPAMLIGTWTCVTKGGGSIPDVNDTQTFDRDGSYSSSSFPEGKKYKYRVDGDKLVISFSSGDWSGKINRLAANSLEYFRDAAGQVKVDCTKK